jgi:hypothetical protein
MTYNIINGDYVRLRDIVGRYIVGIVDDYHYNNLRIIFTNGQHLYRNIVNVQKLTDSEAMIWKLENE